MTEIGILPDALKLLDGEIIRKIGQGILHARVISLLFAWLIRAFGEASVMTQATIDVAPKDNPTNAPEPDFCILKRSLTEIHTAPTPDIIELIIEVAHTSKKADLYARAAFQNIGYMALRINSFTSIGCP